MALAFLADWLRRRPSGKLEHLHVVFYTRRGCHLCEDAWNLLQAEQRRYGFRIDVVDVDASPELAARYGPEVPVVSVDDKVRFRGGVNRVLWRRLLRSLAATRRGARR